MKNGDVKMLIRNLRKMSEQKHDKQALDLANVGDMCPSHKPNLKDSYVQWQDWAESQAKKGIKQTQCEKCKRWFFPSEL